MQSLEALEIQYAVQNYMTGGGAIPFNTRRVHLVDTNKQGGITFRCDNNLSSKPKAKLCFSEALKQWRCATGVNFIIGKDTNIATIRKDGISHVKFATAAEFSSLGIPPTKGAFTMTNNTYFYTCGNISTFIPAGHSDEIDLFFLDDPTLWYMDTLSSSVIPAGQYDFYSICLHEQGHGHRLRHALNDTKVMFWAIDPMERRRTFNTADILGGINVVDNSVQFRPAPNPNACQPTPMKRVLPGDCSNLTATVDINKKNNYFIKSYPNPSEESHYIDFELPSNQVVEIRIYDLLGKVLLSTKRGKWDAGSHTVELNSSTLPKGLYLIEVTVGSEGYLTKFVKN